jgi:hypothetical protein
MWHLSSGALLGALGGALVAGALHAMRTRRDCAEDLGVEAPALRADAQLAEMLSRFRPLARHSSELEERYHTMVRTVDELVRLATQSSATGAVQFKANRLVYLARDCARGLCQLAFRNHQDPLGPEMLLEMNNFEGLLNNHLHNIMLGP